MLLRSMYSIGVVGAYPNIHFGVDNLLAIEIDHFRSPIDEGCVFANLFLGVEPFSSIREVVHLSCSTTEVA